VGVALASGKDSTSQQSWDASYIETTAQERGCWKRGDAKTTNGARARRRAFERDANSPFVDGVVDTVRLARVLQREG
jgi:hypothetical protein